MLPRLNNPKITNLAWQLHRDKVFHCSFKSYMALASLFFFFLLHMPKKKKSLHTICKMPVLLGKYARKYNNRYCYKHYVSEPLPWWHVAGKMVVTHTILMLMNCSAGKKTQCGKCLYCKKELVFAEQSSRWEPEVNKECGLGWLKLFLSCISVILSVLEKYVWNNAQVWWEENAHWYLCSITVCLNMRNLSVLCWCFEMQVLGEASGKGRMLQLPAELYIYFR